MSDDAANGAAADGTAAGAADGAAQAAGGTAAETADDGTADAAGGHAGPAPGTVFSLGWLMAQLFSAPEDDGGTAGGSGPGPAAAAVLPGHLPTVAELGQGERMTLAFAELEDLLGARQGLVAALETTWAAIGHAGYGDAVLTLHKDNISVFAHDQKQLSAYQLGAALSDMCWLPDKPPSSQSQSARQESAQFLQEFERHRLATVQTWLAEAGSELPGSSGGIVSRSLQNWQNWADVNASSLDSGWAAARPAVVDALRAQARAWHAALSGRTDTSGQTSVGAWVEAGESILRTTRMLGLRTLRRFWPVVAVILAATGGLLYLAIANTQGTASVWASVVTVAGAFGISGASLRAAAKKAAGSIEKDVTAAAVLDAQAWAVTWLPTLPQGLLQQTVRQIRLRRRGVAAPQAKKGLDQAIVSALGERPDHQPRPRLGAE